MTDEVIFDEPNTDLQIYSTGMPGSGGGGGGGSVWGQITGTLSNQDDLQVALNLKANSAALAAVAFSGAYADLSGTPAIPTLLSQLTNDTGFITSSALAPYLTSATAASTYATQAALAAKQETLVSGTNIKTINGTSVLGSGDIVISSGSGDVVGPASATDNALARFDATTGKLIQNSGVILDDSNNLTGLGTVASGAQAITSTSAAALVVGRNGATNPALQVDASTASSATGIAIASKAAGGGVTLTAISSGTNESLTISSKGFANLVLNGGTASVGLQNNTVQVSANGWMTASYSFRGYTANTAYSFTGIADSNLTASTECMSFDLNFGQVKSHSTGAITTQRDVRIVPSTHAFAGASTITNAHGVWIAGAVIAGTNASITNSYGLTIGSLAVGAGVTNSYGLNVEAQTGATNNYAARFGGNVVTTGTYIQRVVELTDAPTVTPNCNTTDIGELATLSQATTIANPTGTPFNGQKMMLWITSSSSQTLAFGSAYAASADLALPTATTGGGKMDCLGLVYSASKAKWLYMAKNFGF